MGKYLAVTNNLLTKFREVRIEQVRRDLNSHVNTLADLVSVFEREIGRTVVVDLISAPVMKCFKSAS